MTRIGAKAQSRGSIIKGAMKAEDNPMNRCAGFREPLSLFRYTAEQREEILAALKGVLAAQPEVVFAYAYGSFLENRPFRDIDVGIYVTVEDERRAASLVLDTATTLEAAVRCLFMREPRGVSGENCPCLRCPPVDVRVLNWAPVSFCYHVLRGRLLFSRDEDVRARWAERVISCYLDSRPLRHRALKEAMLSWT